jgi:indolepyruvate ferredoxin oxidoreductase alpha subunit
MNQTALDGRPKLGIKLMTGNEALALGALHAGIKVAAGYPGTPSSGALESLLLLNPPDVHVEWSTNEKVAFEIALGAAWAGHRALCTMKMSGLNVAYDSLISAAYSGIVGGLVIYVADDPGVSAGMAEQDSRGFALMSDLPMIEPTSAAEAYQLVQTAFEISERTSTPVFVRLVTSTSSSFAPVQIRDDYAGPLDRQPVLIRDINKFTKAGSAICMAQHRDLIARLDKAGQIVEEMRLNTLQLAPQTGGVGIVVSGVVASYLDEGLEIASRYGLDQASLSVLRVVAVHPFPTRQAQELLRHCGTILILEELEPYIERSFYVEAQRMGYQGKLLGKVSGLFERVGEYGLRHVVQGISAATGLATLGAADAFQGNAEAEKLAAARPITVCAGCPHRGTFMAISNAIRKARFKKDEVMVTGDIGCTILGMNPPFNTVWNELSMGASIGLAQGFAYSSLKTPVIATIGDSTFFHAGLPALANAVQHQVPITLIIMDNGWTSMTGMQVNAGTSNDFQPSGSQRLDIAKIVPAMGVDQFFVIDPFDLDHAAETIKQAIELPGVKVVLARQECVIPARRRGLEAGSIRVIAENCNLCKLCITTTGCMAITLGEDAIVIDPELCYGCNLCGAVCNREAIEVTG